MKTNKGQNKMKTNDKYFNMIIANKNGTHGTTYEISALIQHIEHEGIKKKMIKLNNEYHDWLNEVIDKHYAKKYPKLNNNL
jgi:hypothetical protein